MKLAVAGAGGRMGAALIRAIAERDDVVLVAAFEREGAAAIGADSGERAGLGRNDVPVSDDLDEAIAKADGLLDFTAPDATVGFAEALAQEGRVHVIGTTGFETSHEDALKTAAERAVIVKSGNMSLGVNLLAELVRQAARALPESFDIEVLEMHHKHKVDAPSGTALLLGEAAAEGRGLALAANAVRSRDGQTGARPDGAIGFATLRGGSVVGDHSVIMAGVGERITLSHHAEDRAIFARGAVTAALWAHGRAPGFYSMIDVLGIRS
ncbi:4-hydroxy-tetrahydrodipicolinate reductase [Notoacmeibacter sp. MSK16QG-6]|uniref:4-hydroxy-tetrahydrodipicolinate reductase n=1 Tax=Notoacmeibacter sp. MSK16QG-6 TaxID=2957982 RepID=UPI0020A025A9|nr:4-hydroxy-tetrahydrodipicolinate reductase [Notoacmeibacter sp. MSK16QG-6]MCP1198949.1 4-hydroxy-tetrahydrodipicolinate reductase [Notoacmeibacter sp. MSK16QG-6]